jgi:hypothetical protein
MTSAPISVPVEENRPAASDVPPMTTARIASSSIHRPALCVAALVLAAMTGPRCRRHSRRSVDVQMIVRDRTPASRLASGLMPTASMQHPERRAPGEQRGQRADGDAR